MTQNSDAPKLTFFLDILLKLNTGVIAAAFFFGSAVLVGKSLIARHLAMSVGISDVIGEAIFVTPVCVVVVHLLAVIAYNLDKHASLPGLKRSILSSAVLATCVIVVIAPFVAIVMYDMLTGMVVFSVSLSIAAAIYLHVIPKLMAPRMGLILRGFILLAMCFMSVMYMAAALPLYRSRITDGAIRDGNYEVCAPVCHPGLVITSTNSLTVVRYWGDRRMHYIPTSLIIRIVSPNRFIEAN